MKISDTVFVVTGAAGGIGGALVETLVAQGAIVAAVDVRDEPLQELKRNLAAKSHNISTHVLDITDRDAVYRLPEAVISAHGRVDALINCAGIVQPFVEVDELDDEDIERVMRVNFFGTLYMTRAFLPYFRKRPEGYPEAHLVNISSMGAFVPVPGQDLYGAFKAAVKLLTEGLYAKYLGTNLHVTVVFPGATRTEITQNSGVEAPTLPDNFPMLAPTKAAEIIVRGIEKNKPRIFTGMDSRLMDILYRLSPLLATKIIARQMKSLVGK